MKQHSRRRKLAREMGEVQEPAEARFDSAAARADRGRNPLSALLEAARNGQDRTVERLVSGGAPVNGIDKDGWSPVMAAAMGDHPSTIRLLAGLGADLDLAVEPRRRTALCEAAWQENASAVKALLECGADPNLADTLCGPPVGDTQCCDCILLLARAGADVRGARSRYPICSLAEHVARKGRLDVLQELVDRGAALDSGVLVGAVSQGRYEVVRWLLDRNVDPNAATEVGERPVHAACGRGLKTQFLELLLEHGAKLGGGQGCFSELRSAVMGDNLEALEFLLVRGLGDHGVGEPALHLAANLDRLVVLERLLRAGMDVDLRAFQEQTPLMRAAAAGALSCICALVDAGANLEARDHQGRSALFWALSYAQTAAVQSLLKAGADLEARDQHGQTPLLAAAGSLHAATMVSLLLRAGANLEVCDNDGATPLLLSLIYDGNCDRAAAHALLAAGASSCGVLARFCEVAAWQNPWRERDERREAVFPLLVKGGEDPKDPAVLLYAKVRQSRKLEAFLADHGVTRKQINDVEVPAGLGYDWH